MMKGLALLCLALLPQEKDPLPALLDKLRAETIEERTQAGEAILKLGAGCVPRLAEALAKETDAEQRRRLEELIRFLRPPAVDTAGKEPRLSPDGRRVAFVRYEATDDTDMRGNRVFLAETWIRDIRRGAEDRLAQNAFPVAWVGDDQLQLSDERVVDVASGKAIEGAAKLPEGASYKRLLWAPGGRQLAYVPAGKGDAIVLVDAAGKERKIPLGHDLMNDDSSGFLSWSPGGAQLAFHLLFFRKGNLPLRRIGVVDAASGKVALVGEGAYVHGNRGLGYDEDGCPAWDAKGRRFAFVTGRGDGEGEVHLSGADGVETLKLSDDLKSKWSARLDPAGRRVAYCSGTSTEEGLKDQVIQVLDLFTGDLQTFRPEASAEDPCSHLQWTPDGSSLVYASGGRIREWRPQPPAPAPADAKIVVKSSKSAKEELLAALGSGKGALVEWAAQRAPGFPGADVVAALRSALKKAAAESDYRTPWALMDALEALDAREAAPEILEAAASKNHNAVVRAIHLLRRWKPATAKEKLLEWAKGPAGDPHTVAAAAALPDFGSEAGWGVLQEGAKTGSKELRWQVVTELATVRDPRSVAILIGLVPVDELLYISIAGETQVGDLAERSLAKLTGETFGRDPAKWKAWWAERKEQLPELKGPNRGLEKLDQEERKKIEERGK